MIEKQKAIDVFADAKEILEVSDILVKVSGSSMWPFFKDGKTKVKLSKIDEIKKGHIYLFKKEESYVLHRLIKIKDDQLIFQGDGNIIKEVVFKEALIAKLTAYKINGKKEIKATNNFYKFKVLVYRLLPRKLIIKLFKRENDK